MRRALIPFMFRKSYWTNTVHLPMWFWWVFFILGALFGAAVTP